VVTVAPRRTAEATDELRASLLAHAEALIRRDGPQALTMRALAAEAECAVGLPYKVFASREDLVGALAHAEMTRLTEEFAQWVAGAGTRTVGENLGRYATILVETDRPALILAGMIGDAGLDASVAGGAHETGLLASFDTAVTDYLRAEQRLGRVAADVDVKAYGFLVTGALHNLAVSPAGYPRPDARTLKRLLSAVARQIAPRD
jgi:AcrR family transcriptional regulator